MSQALLRAASQYPILAFNHPSMRALLGSLDLPFKVKSIDCWCPLKLPLESWTLAPF